MTSLLRGVSYITKYFGITKRGLRGVCPPPPKKKIGLRVKIRAILGIINLNIIIFSKDSRIWKCLYFWKRKVEGGCHRYHCTLELETYKLLNINMICLVLVELLS